MDFSLRWSKYSLLEFLIFLFRAIRWRLRVVRYDIKRSSSSSSKTVVIVRRRRRWRRSCCCCCCWWRISIIQRRGNHVFLWGQNSYRYGFAKKYRIGTRFIKISDTYCVHTVDVKKYSHNFSSTQKLNFYAIHQSTQRQSCKLGILNDLFRSTRRYTKDESDARKAKWFLDSRRCIHRNMWDNKESRQTVS